MCTYFSCTLVLRHRLKAPESVNTTSLTHIHTISLSEKEDKIAVFVEGDNVYSLDFLLVKVSQHSDVYATNCRLKLVVNSKYLAIPNKQPLAVGVYILGLTAMMKFYY